MAVTAEVALTGAWKAVATAGEVVFTPSQGGVVWAITGTTTAPTFTGGHGSHPTEDVSLTLSGTERLWLRGDGVAYVTADAPVV